MKKLYNFLLLTLFFTQYLISQNLITDDFLYETVDSLEHSGNWFRSGVNSIYNVKVVKPGLEYKDYVGSKKGNCVVLTNNGEGDVLYNNLAEPVTTGSVFLSFMFSLDSLPSTITEAFCIGFNPNTGGTNINTTLHIKRVSDTSFYLGVQKQIEKNVVYSNSIYKINRTYLIVLKYSILHGSALDSSSLFVFSNGVPTFEPNFPSATTTDGTDYTGQGSIILSNNYAQTGLKGCIIRIDGIRVGTSWESSVLAPVSSTKSASPASNLIQLECVPNPFYQSTTIAYQIPFKGLVKINILNSSGTEVRKLVNETLEPGTHEYVLDANDLPAGMYHCSIQFNGSVVSKRIIHHN